MAGVAGAALGLLAAFPAGAQIIGSYDNFDCFNDTGQVAEGFEIDIEDVATADLIREFPSNFSTTPWVTRYGLPAAVFVKGGNLSAYLGAHINAYNVQ